MSPAQTPAAQHGLGWLNDLPADEAVRQLRSCCASTAWAREVSEGRPYASESAAVESSDAAFAALTEADIDEALAAHPRIGERAQGASREAQWSRSEQSGAADADEQIQRELVAANVAYESKFGHVFLIRASGRSAA